MVKRITGMLCALALLVSMVTVSVSAASDGASVAKPMLSLAEAEIIPFFGEGNDNFDFPQTTGRFYSNTLGNFLSVETWRKAGVEVIANFGDYDMDAFQFAFNLHFKNGANVYAGRNVVTFIAGDLELVFTRNSGNFDFDVSASYAGEALALSSTSLLALPFGDYGYNTEGHKALYQTFKEATPPEDDTADNRMALKYFPTMVYPLSITVSGGQLSICNRYSPTAASITATLENPDFTQANVSLSLLGRSGTSFFCGDVVGSYNGIANGGDGGDGGVDLPVDDTEGMMPDTADAILTPYYGEGQTGFDYPQTTGCFVSEEIGSFLSVETERSTGIGLTADYGRYDMDSFMFGFALCFKNGTEYAGRNVVAFTAGDLVVTFTRNGEDFGYDIAATYAGQPLALAVTSTGADNVVEMGYNTEEQQNVYDMFLAATPPEDGAADKRMGQDAFATAVMPVLILYEDGMLYIGAPVTEEDLETGIIEADLEFADADVSLNVFGKDGISVICAGMTGMVFETGFEPPRDVETTEMDGLDQATCEIPEDLNWNSAGSGLGKTSLTGDALFVGGSNVDVNLTANVGTYAIDSYFKLNFDLFAKTGSLKNNGIAEGNENWVVTVGDFEFTFTRPTLGDADLNEHTMLQSVTFKGEELAIQGDTVYTRDHRVTHDYNDPKTIAAAQELKQYTEDNFGRLGWMFTNGLPDRANFWPTFHHSVEIVYDNGKITVTGGIGNDTGVAPAVATVDATSVVDTTQELGACEVSVNAHATAARKTYISIIGNFAGVYEEGTTEDWDYTGLVNIDGEWYYVVDGKFCEETTLVNYYDTWYYVENGVLNWDYTGLVNYYGTWYYVENGVLNWGATTLTNYYGTWYYVENGILNWGATTLCNYYDTWYYVENGILNWNATTLVNYYGTWYYVENGVLNWGATTLCNYYGTWYYVENGVLNWNATTLVNYYGTWYYVENGVLNWNATTLVNYYDTWYYVENGVLNWNYTGSVNYYGTDYSVVNGVVVF